MDHNKKEKINIKDSVLSKIHAGEFSMRPKFYFTLKVFAFILTALAVLIISVFLLNFILFSIRINSQETLLHFGPRGWSAFLQFFPWPLLVLDLALISFLQWLLREFKFGYKIPVLYLLAALMTGTLVLGFTIDRGTPFNDRLLRQSDEHRLPPFFSEFYGRARHLPPPDSGYCLCIIENIAGNRLTVRDPRSTTTLTIILPSNDPRATTTSLQVGDTILVAGDINGTTIQAFGVHKAPPPMK